MAPASCISALFVTQLIVRHPETQETVELEIWQDPSSNALFGVDVSFLDQVSHVIRSPYNPAITLLLHEDTLTGLTSAAPA